MNENAFIVADILLSMCITWARPLAPAGS